jgi:DNA invertase Pin-like site-specific DNA recombinase
MKTCAIYARVSTNDQSCELQIRELVEYAARRDWKVVLILEEKISGTISDRPKLKELLCAARSRKIDIVFRGTRWSIPLEINFPIAPSTRKSCWGRDNS